MGYIIYITIAGLFLSVHVIDSTYTLICEYKNNDGDTTASSLYALATAVSFLPYVIGFYWFCSSGSLVDMLLGLVMSAITSIFMVIVNHTVVIDDYKSELRLTEDINKQKTIKL